MGSKRALVPDHVVFRAYPNETVALNLDTGRYHGLNPVAGRMLEALLGAEEGFQQAVSQLADEYDRPPEAVEAELRRLCDDLAERGLIELRLDRAA